MSRDYWVRLSFWQLASGLMLLVTFLARPNVASAQWEFHNFESGPTRPVALSPGEDVVAVTNVPDQRVEFFGLNGEDLEARVSVRVGLEPVSVQFRTDDECWVVNHLSDSVSVIDLSGEAPEVVATLQVGDEPGDIVFAGPDNRYAFVSAAHRGQNSPEPTGEFATPGVGRADVWVFDTRTVRQDASAVDVVTMFGDKPRALAVTPDGGTVYAAVFHSGNQTTTIPESTVCDGGPSAGPCAVGNTQVPGGLPGPRDNHEGRRAPETGLIVRWEPLDEAWLDELGRDWSGVIPFSVPDYDVFAIDAMDDEFIVTERFSGVGTILFGMAVDPATGDVLVANTDARNEVRFEGPGNYVRNNALKPEGEPETVRGHLHESRITRIRDGVVEPFHLNPHVDYDAIPTPPGTSERSLATPGQVYVMDDGTVLVAAMGSDRVARLRLPPEGELPAEDGYEVAGIPVGFAVAESSGLLLVYTRLDNALVVLDLETGAELSRTPMFSAEPERHQRGRQFLYDARLTSSNGEASCASCHVFGDTDSLAWDLGDPDGTVEPNPNPVGLVGSGDDFHPMKGPMLTQTFRGLDNHGPLHWRGDRTGENTAARDAMDELAAFTTFNVAFEGLLGRDEGPIPDEDMEDFAAFATAIRHPPNPIRQLDNSLRPDEAVGEDLYFNGPHFDQVATCNGCHVTDGASGLYGTDGRVTFEGEPQEFKVAQLRNVYQRVGMFGMAAAEFFASSDSIGGAMGPQVRAFGMLHDGSVDTVRNFLHADVFVLLDSDEQRDALEAYVMAFPGELAPIVGQQVTLDGSEAALERAQLLIAQAQSPFAHPLRGPQLACDVIAHATVNGVERGFVYRPEFQAWQSDRAMEARLTSTELLAIAESDGSRGTVTAVPPGSGWRMGVDRDGDEALDGDEREQGTDPASPHSVPPDLRVPSDPPVRSPPRCEEDPSQERCDEVDPCDTNPLLPTCPLPPTCDDDPNQAHCEPCPDGQQRNSAGVCEKPPHCADGSQSSACADSGARGCATGQMTAPGSGYSVLFVAALLLAVRRRNERQGETGT